MKYVDEFKNGVFENKKEFVNYVVSSNDKSEIMAGLRTFAAVCTHEDFELLNDFLSSCDEDCLYAFLAYVKESLSLQAIPYLLALLEMWEETDTGVRIHQIIMEMLGKYCDEEYSDVEECGNEFIEFSKTHDLKKYYFRGEVINYGGLTKELLTFAMKSKSLNRPFNGGTIAGILSNSFGISCPVSDREMVTDEKVAMLFEFVKKIAAINPEVGAKYYYGRKIG